MKKTNFIPIIAVVLIIAALITFLSLQAKKPGKYDSLAQCISDSGAKFYGAWWCSHCQATKALFGRSAKKLPYIECQTQDQKQTQQCDDIGIKGYPTWIFADGTQLTGERTLEELAAKTSCQPQLEADSKNV